MGENSFDEPRAVSAGMRRPRPQRTCVCHGSIWPPVQTVKPEAAARSNELIMIFLQVCTLLIPADPSLVWSN